VRKRKRARRQTGRPSPSGGKQVNFEPDSAFRKEKRPGESEAKGEKKAKKPSAKTQKIAAATKAKRAAKKKIAE
jgi:ribonuclease R